MPVIAISRLTGSGGATIGQRLAEHLFSARLGEPREVAGLDGRDADTRRPKPHRSGPA